MMEWTIRRLDSKHDRTAFDCGQPMLNDCIKVRASQFDRRDLSRTFVASVPDSDLVCGYYAISSHHVAYSLLPPKEAKGLPRMDVPVVLLGRLAVDQRSQGQGLGSTLLVDALERVSEISELVGIRAVEVDAIDEAARDFYFKFGFQSFLDDPRHLFMPIHEVREISSIR